MKKNVVLLLVGFFFIGFFTTSVNAQIISPFAQDQQMLVSDLKLNPYRPNSLQSGASNGYALEFLGYELGYLGGSAISAGLFLGGFLTAWGGDNYIGVPLILASGLTALATPVLAAYTMKLFGRKYRPEGKIGTAIWGSYLGIAVTAGSSLLLNYLALNLRSNQDEYRGPGRGYSAINTTALLLLPGLITVAIYNIYPKAKTEGIGNALVNRNSGKFSPGIPSFSIAQNPSAPGTHFTQFKLLSVSF